MKLIPLTKGKFAIVDDEDYEHLSRMKWTAYVHLKSGKCYAVWGRREGKVTIVTPMHRLLLGLKKGDGLEADHINGDTLDNRRSNLRACTHQQNTHNKPVRKDNESGYKGVHPYRVNRKLKWHARIQINGIIHYLGYFDCPIEAAKAYNSAATQVHGQFARLNPIPT